MRLVVLNDEELNNNELNKGPSRQEIIEIDSLRGGYAKQIYHKLGNSGKGLNSDCGDKISLNLLFAGLKIGVQKNNKLLGLIKNWVGWGWKIKETEQREYGLNSNCRLDSQFFDYILETMVKHTWCGYRSAIHHYQKEFFQENIIEVAVKRWYGRNEFASEQTLQAGSVF